MNSGVAEIDRSGHVARRHHHAHHALDEVVDIAEGARLQAVAVERDVLAPERLHDEVRDHAPVVRVHAGSVGVEDPDDLDLQLVLAAVVEEQRLGAALALVVAGARPDRIDVAPVALGLRVHGGIAVDLRGRGLQDRNPEPLGEAQHVDRAEHAGLGRLHRIELVVHRRGGTGEVVDPIHFHVERPRHVVARQVEAGLADQVLDVASGARVEVVDAEHLLALGYQPFAEVGADEPGAARDQHALGEIARRVDLRHLWPSPPIVS